MEAFISLDDLAAHLHLPSGALDDDEGAQQAADGACDWLRTLTGQSFDYVEGDVVLMDGTGTDALLLPELPVPTVSSVIVTGASEGYGFTLHDNGTLIRTYEPDGSDPTWALWPVGRNNVEVTYTHGYPEDDFPADLRMVALKMAARFYQQTGGVVFESLGQRSVRYESAAELSTVDSLIIRKHTFHRQPSRVVVTS